MDNQHSDIVRKPQHASSADYPPVAEQQLELLEVTYSGIDPQLYTSLRESGISHSETMEASALGADLEAYCYLRTVYDHDAAVIEAGSTGTATHHEAILLGVQPAELAELRESYRSHVNRFWKDKASPTAHNVSIRPAPPMTTDYLAARRVGLAHGSALDLACRIAVSVSRGNGVRMPPREVELWARCRLAGLAPSMTAIERPVLDVDQLVVLHAALFLLQSTEQTSAIPQAELLWLAGRSGPRHIDVQRYVKLRRKRWPRRLAARRSTIASQPATTRHHLGR